MQILGLSNSADTIIGDKLLERGVSGGERRRVTIGVELVKGPNCVLLDEPTTGLDSSTALGVGEALRTISRSGPPVCAALLQPSWELLNTFDRLLLLSKGQVVYWGPVREGNNEENLFLCNDCKKKKKTKTKKKKKNTRR